jgi:hypothetical protein
MKRILFNFLVFFISSFSIVRGVDGLSSRQADLEKAVQKANHYGLVCEHQPTLFKDGLTYWLDTQVRLNRARISHKELQDLYSKIYKEMISAVNEQKTIRPYLAVFPLTPETFFVTVHVETDIGEDDRKAVSTARIRQDMLETDIETLSGRDVKRMPVREIEALRALYTPTVKRDSTLKRSPRELQGLFPFIEHIVRDECREKKETFEIAAQLCRKYHLNILTLGSVGKDKSVDKLYQVALMGFGKMKLEEARLLVGECGERFLKAAKKNSPFSRNPNKKSQDQITELLLKEIAFRISFWDASIERPLAPAIAEIQCSDGICEYFTAADNQQLVLVFKENIAKPSPQAS